MYIIEVNNIYRDEKTLYQVNTTIFPTDVQKIVDEAHKEALKVGAYYCKFRDELGKHGIVEVKPVVIVEIPL